MKRLIACVSLSLLSVFTFSQQTYFHITGKIIDETSGQSLQAASVFAQNTTFGTATDANGNFDLRLPSGGYDLIVTFTGYETESRRISSSDNDNRSLIITMKQKDKAMEAVAIVASNEVKNGWEQYGDFFTENFIGKTENSKSCVIKNNNALKFYYSKRKNRLKVLASEPIEIENKALGYNIKYTLDSFTYEYATQVAVFSGYPLFEEMTTDNAAVSAVWKDNRKNAYKGSILQFMRSIYQQKLKEDGYEIQFVINSNDYEKSITLKDFYKAINYKKDDSTQTVTFLPNQENIAVIYKNAAPDKLYLQSHEVEDSSFQLSIVKVAPQQSITIEQNGYYFNQEDLTLSGYWMWEKVGDMLPYDYKPE